MTVVEYSGNVLFSAGDVPLVSEWDGITHVRYTEAPTIEQVNWGNSADPTAAPLQVGEVYAVDRIVIHSWHTKIFLTDIDSGNGFNSVTFQAVTA